MIVAFFNLRVGIVQGVSSQVKSASLLPWFLEELSFSFIKYQNWLEPCIKAAKTRGVKKTIDLSYNK